MGNLFEFMKSNRLSEDDVVNIFYQVSSAINYLHKQKILHRDIKPENILMKDRTHAKLCDFGFCAPYGTDVVRQTMCGTTEYLPPEIIGREDQNDKVDIWCLGVLLYEMTHSKTPFEGQNIHMLQFQQKKHAIKFRPDLNPQLRTIIEKCLEFEPERRPAADEILSFPIFGRLKAEGENQQQKQQKQSVEADIYRKNNELNSGQQHSITPNLYQQPLPQQQYTGHQAPIQNIYANKNNGQSMQAQLPLRIDPSPNRVIYKNDMFRKQRAPDTIVQEPAREPKVIKYSITRITRDGREITETRSTSQSHGSGEIVHNTLANGGSIVNGNVRTVRVVTQNASVDKKIDPTNFYKQFNTKYSHATPNMYSPSPNTYTQGNTFVTRNIYANSHELNNGGPTIYKHSDRQIPSYAPKEYKYSYNKPGPEKPLEPKMSYHASNTQYTYNNVYNDGSIRRGGVDTTGRYPRSNNSIGSYSYNGTVVDKNRSRSSNDNGVSGGGLTTRIVRQK